MSEVLSVLLFGVICLALMLGYPVAFTLGGVSLLFAMLGSLAGVFDSAFLEIIPNRIYGIILNQNLLAVPLFVFMGVMLEKSRLAEELLQNMARVFGRLPGGLGVSVVIVGMLLAASTGIVGATVVTMGVLSLPTMLKSGYKSSFACGTLCATGTLGQIIPPSICLVLLGEVLSSAYQQSQLASGVFSPDVVTIGDLFAGALLPGLLLVLLYGTYVVATAVIRPELAPGLEKSEETVVAQVGAASVLLPLIKGLLPPVLLIVAVLGSILGGLATPTEAASVGAIGATLLALVKRQLRLKVMHDVAIETMRITSMVYLILIGATIFSSVFRGFGGDVLIEDFLGSLPGGVVAAMFLVMVLVFLLGFILDFIEITFMVVPLVGPVLLSMGLDPVWLGIMLAINLQTSFLTPPFGFSLFYLRSVAPPQVTTTAIYRGVIPFVLIQLFALLLLSVFPELATWLPDKLSR